MSDIQVLLAIKNGEKYLAELLTSLVEQKECEIHLIVGFDNTNDRSETILESFKQEREHYEFLMTNRAELDLALKVGAEKASSVADSVLKRVRQKVGY